MASIVAPSAAFLARSRKEPKALETTLFKTKLCVHWQQGACCRAQCSFAHGEHELHIAPNFKKTTMCSFMQEDGRCRLAECRFANSEDELRPFRQPLKLTSIGSQDESVVELDGWHRRQARSPRRERASDASHELELTGEAYSWSSAKPPVAVAVGSGSCRTIPANTMSYCCSLPAGSPESLQTVSGTLVVPPMHYVQIGYCPMWVPWYAPYGPELGGSSVDMGSATGNSPTHTRTNFFDFAMPQGFHGDINRVAEARMLRPPMPAHHTAQGILRFQ